MQTAATSKPKKNFFARLTKCGIAALCLVLGVFIVGACTIGGFSSPGRAYFAPAESELVFYLDYPDTDAPLAEVYINVGSVYAVAGENLELSFRHASASGPYSSGRFSAGALGDVTIGNIYSASGEGVSGANYNWVRAFDLRETTQSVAVSSYRLIRITVPCDMLINEVVFVDTNGDVIPAYAGESAAKGYFSSQYWSSYRDLFHGNDRTSTYGSLGDPANLTDSPRYAAGGNAYTDFTQDEMYVLQQIDNIRLGTALPDGYPLSDTDSGPLSTLLSMLGVLVFGACPFGLRLPSVLCTAALVGVAYLLGKELFGKKGYALLLAGLVAGGGLALTVGRLGLSLAPAALCALLAYYFMYRFFRRGASLEAPSVGARNVLFAGIAFAFAFAFDPKSLFTLIGLVALLVAGIVRIRREQRRQLAALEGEGEEPAPAPAAQPVPGSAMAAAPAPSAEDAAMRREAAAERAEAMRDAGAYRTKLLVAFILLGFVAVTAVLYILGSLPLYFTYVRLYEADPASPVLGIFTLIGRAFSDAFTLDNATAFSAANAASPFGWLIAFKGATLFSASTDAVYAALNAQPNIAMALTALVAFLLLTAGIVVYKVTGGKNGPFATPQAGRIFGAYILLTAGSLTSLLQFAFTGGASAAQGLLFQCFYIGFIPLLLYTSAAYESGASVRLFGRTFSRTVAIGGALVAVYAIVFALSLPMYFGIPLAPAAATGLFGWTSFANNGFYRM